MSLSGKKKTLFFSPHNPSTFLVAGNDLRLFKLLPDEKVNLVAQSETKELKCFSWSLNPSTPELVALGMTTGKVVLSKLPGFEDGAEYPKEFLSRLGRSCNVVAFNPVFHSQLFGGFDRLRSEPTMVIWDVNFLKTGYGTNVQSYSRQKQKPLESEGGRPIFFTESVASAAWFKENPYCIAVGISPKTIKLFDLRGDWNTSSMVISSKAVHGICTDPFYEHRFASYDDEGTIKVWDIRKVTNEPVLNLTEAKPVVDIQWSPVRPNLLASLSKDEDFVSFWELQDQVGSGDDRDRIKEFGLWRSSRSLGRNSNLSAFVWHSSYENKLLAINKFDAFVHLKVPFSLNIYWSPFGYLATSAGNVVTVFGHPSEKNRTLSSVQVQKDSIFLPIVPSFISEKETPTRGYYEDISLTMRERAKINYSMDVNVNLSIASNSGSRPLQELWGFMSRSLTLAQINQTQSQPSQVGKPQEPLFAGIFSILSGRETISRTPSGSNLLTSAPSKPSNRKMALQLCGWGFDTPKNDFASQLLKLEEAGFYERAAALALFNNDIRRAIRSLNSSPSEQLKLVSLALAGYAEEQRSNTLWKETVGVLTSQFQHPYLRAIFSFLTSTNPSSILENEGLSLADRVGFACCVLSDQELFTFMKRAMDDCIKKGDLEGILLTGLTKEGVELLEAYIDQTTDVQTPVLALCHVIPKEFKDKRADKWLEIYRDLLDNWQLWSERALFDIARQKMSNEEKPPVQVFARCNFCGSSISYSPATAATNSTTRKMPFASGAAGNVQAKPTVCAKPDCRKPLPRCSLCLLHLGTPAPSFHESQGDGETSQNKKPASIDLWFTWCQTCRHGGHVVHIEDWFSTHQVCPVADCNCRCVDHDSITLK